MQSSGSDVLPLPHTIVPLNRFPTNELLISCRYALRRLVHDALKFLDITILSVTVSKFILKFDVNVTVEAGISLLIVLIKYVDSVFKYVKIISSVPDTSTEVGSNLVITDFKSYYNIIIS